MELETPVLMRVLAPHIGHLYTLVLSDILKRWQVLRGKKAILCTGTDEHGMKVSLSTTDARLLLTETRFNVLLKMLSKMFGPSAIRTLRSLTYV